jgi:hypothetical protein
MRHGLRYGDLRAASVSGQFDQLVCERMKVVKVGVYI